MAVAVVGRQRRRHPDAMETTAPARRELPPVDRRQHRLVREKKKKEPCRRFRGPWYLAQVPVPAVGSWGRAHGPGRGRGRAP